MSEQPAEIRYIQGTVNGRPLPRLEYPYSPLLRQVAQEVFNGEYPFLPWLEDQEGTILDVGANVGFTTALFRTLYPKTTIHAFEPDPACWEFLRKNTSAMEGVYPHRVGLYDYSHEHMAFFQGSLGSVTNSLFRSAQTQEGSISVAVKRAASVLVELGIARIKLLKIDTEGAELPILWDLKNYLEGKLVEAVAVEYHSEEDRRQIDVCLSDRDFYLYGGVIHRPGLGCLTYVHGSVDTSKGVSRES